MASTESPVAGTVAGTISANAARLSEALNNHMRNSFQPESRKTLRKFHPAEVSELTGISMSNPVSYTHPDAADDHCPV